MTRSPRAGVALLAIVLVSSSTKADAPFDRYEVGRRLREFEAAWDGRDRDATARATVSGHLQRAVSGFFGGRMTDAGKSVTEAHLSLDDPQGDPPLAARRWAESLQVKPSVRLLDTTATKLPVTIAAYYPVELPGNAPTLIRLSLGTFPGSQIEAPISREPLTIDLPLKNTLDGDHALVVEILVGGKVAATNRQTISLVDRLDARLAALKTTTSQWPNEPATSATDRESARSAQIRLQALAARRTPESDVPAAKILADLEEQVKAVEAGTAFLTKNRIGQFWVTVPRKNGGSIATRIFVPEASAKGEPIPLVVALHGAGGSENMFFETYGHGAIVDRCKERGWLLVAPRSGFFGSVPVDELVDELAKIYPIDPKRVMLVGHSMGAAQAVGAAQTTPTRFAAVAALGGGGSVRAVPDLANVPFFVGVGSDDFALSGARNLADSLRRAKVKNVQFQEYDHVEHLAIMQIALSDVFRFFDQP